MFKLLKYIQTLKYTLRRCEYQNKGVWNRINSKKEIWMRSPKTHLVHILSIIKQFVRSVFVENSVRNGVTVCEAEPVTRFTKRDNLNFLFFVTKSWTPRNRFCLSHISILFFFLNKPSNKYYYLPKKKQFFMLFTLYWTVCCALKHCCWCCCFSWKLILVRWVSGQIPGRRGSFRSYATAKPEKIIPIKK